MQNWFIPQDKRTGKVRQAFEKWPIGLPEQKKSFPLECATMSFSTHGVNLLQPTQALASVVITTTEARAASMPIAHTSDINTTDVE